MSVQGVEKIGNLNSLLISIFCKIDNVVRLSGRMTLN